MIVSLGRAIGGMVVLCSLELYCSLGTKKEKYLHFSPKFFRQGQKFNFLGWLMASAQIRPTIIPVYIFDRDNSDLAQQYTRGGRATDLQLMQQLTQVPHQGNLYVQSFRCLRLWGL